MPPNVTVCSMEEAPPMEYFFYPVAAEGYSDPPVVSFSAVTYVFALFYNFCERWPTALLILLLQAMPATALLLKLTQKERPPHLLVVIMELLVVAVKTLQR